MEKVKKSLLISLAIGDGYIAKQGGTLFVTHSEKQKFYIEYKRKLIQSILNCGTIGIYHRKDQYHDEYIINKSHRYFKIIRNWLYKNNVKCFSKKLLNKLTPEGIAIWWMDDGSHGIDRNKTTGKIRSHSFHLYTYTNEDDTNNIIEMFKEKYDINFYPIRHKSKSGEIQYYLKCRTREGRKLSNLLRQYILPEFQYKIMKENE